ncbi:hypothetical protein MKW94_005088 [Papaver nudicaule]|uniref:phosphatidate phosphatase n=1 Tax=Papaver nudicaule TaxID=74823 RepID=A0AA41SG90_PAPNU|nr:hypothetical protein [Papaver nudicaule]
MYTVARLISRGVYTVSGPFHPFGGAVDIIVVEQPDGSYKSSPWYVRFGKFQGVLKTREKVVNIDVNGIDSDFHMYLDHKGEAFFLGDVKEDDEDLNFTSPLSSGEEEIDNDNNSNNQLVTETWIESQTSDSLSVREGDVNLLPRTNSRRSRLLRYVFGRRASMGQESIERLDSLEEAQVAAGLLEVNWSSNLSTTEVSNSSLNLLESIENDLDLGVNNENEDETAVIFDLNLGEIDNAKPSLEQISRECSDVIGGSLHEEGSQSERVSSYTDCETPDSLGEEKNQFYCETMELGSTKRVSRVLLINEDTEHDLGTCNIQINVIGSGKNGTFTHSNAENIGNESANSLVNMHMLTADTVEPGRMQVKESRVVPERLVGEKKLESDVDEEFFSQSSMKKSSHSHTSNSHLQGSTGSLEPQAQVVSADKFVSSAEERELAESSDEEQFLFSDIDQLESSPVHCKDSVSSNSKETESNSLTSVKDILKDHDTSLSLKTIEQPPLSSQAEFEESRTTSSARSIPSGRRGPSEEVEWMMESLPNFRSGIDNLDVSDVQPLSCSLDSGSESLGWKLFRKDSSKPFTSDIDSGNFLKEQHRSSSTSILEELKRMSSIPEIEISLCKHLLYEGMGIDAASQAFDAEKVDPENFIAAASAPLDSDKLVVRMGGRYFPWDAAVPVISGMASFGHELTFDPEGMIAVEQIEETLEGQSPRSIVASGGSWRLWPFSLRRSRTIGTVSPGLDSTKCEGTDNAPESSNYVSPDRNAQQGNVTVKKVKSIVPTSEQLASLNLKEGQNVIKFTFSTAMLGKQQVDARIFLWKYDARIVVSDVDGTITKSDVLGQFMPLVGKDWSQTGVAHLFSAIKENGYKFIYLSARSVSQAYLTRQFLINLKQDGKALPDGPVVISPDGLFPSLYREVIRRAPHEFKIGCLEDIKALFPLDSHPFYAGFGNRDTDELSYLKVGVPKGKIFTINPKGEVAVHRRVDTKSYTSLHELVNGMFPAMCSAGQEEFNQWNFWKIPPVYIDC